MITNKINIKPTGDRSGDGYIQLSFTIGVNLKYAMSAAVSLCQKMNLHQIEVSDMTAISKEMTYVQLFAKTNFTVEFSTVIEKSMELSREQIIAATEQWEKQLIIIGACTGTDAHTVGLDAILNKKGFKGDKGLESYSGLEVFNLGSQVKNSEIIRQIRLHGANVILVSQIITHQNTHIHNLTELIDMLEAENLRHNLLCLIGGPRITNQLALELGFDGGFGIGTKPLDVANFIYNFFKSFR